MKMILAILALLFILLQVRLWSGAGGIAEIRSHDREIGAQTEENAELAARNDALLQEVTDLKTGLDSVEERARSELGMIKKGETFFLIVEKDSRN